MSSALEGVGLLLLLPLLALTNLNLPIPSFTGPLGFLVHIFEPLRGKVPLLAVLITYVFLVGLLGLLNYARTVEAAELRLSFCKITQNRCHEALLKASLIFHTKNKLADHAQVLTAEVMKLSAAISQWVQLASALGLVMIYMGLAFIVSWKMTLVIMACSLLTILILTKVSKSILSNGRDLHRGTQSLYSEVLNHLNGLKEAKSLCIEPAFQKSFENMNQILFENQLDFAKSNAMTTVVYQIIAAVSLSIIFWVAYSKIHEPWVNLTLLLMLFVRMIPRVNQVHTFYHSVMNLYPSYQAILKVQKGADAAAEAWVDVNLKGRRMDPYSLSLNHVGLIYDQKNILKNISCELRKNSLSLIIGPSGGGKSSFCDLISGLVFPSEGSVLLEGKICEPKDWILWRQSVAYFNQTPFLISGTLRENLCLGSELYTDQDLENALRQAGAWSFVEKLPGKLEALIGDRGVTLSGGQRQRVALARILLKTPKLLILDEVCAHLDTENISWIREQVLFLKSNMMVVIVSHDVNKWQDLADQVLKIDHGQIELIKLKKLKEQEEIEDVVCI